MDKRIITAYWLFFPVTFDLSEKTGIVDPSKWQYVYFTWLLRLLCKFGLPIIQERGTYSFPSLHIYGSLTQDEYREVLHMIMNTNKDMRL